MALEIISLTPKGEMLSRSRVSSTGDKQSQESWSVVYFLGRQGGRSTSDKLVTFCFGGDSIEYGKIIGHLKSKGVVTGE